MSFERKVGRLVIASALLLTTSCESQPLSPPIPTVTRNPKNSLLIGHGRFLEVYGYCNQPYLNPFTDHLLAELESDDQYTVKWAGSDLVQIIKVEKEESTSFRIEMDSNTKKGLHLVTAALTKNTPKGTTILEEIETEFSC